MGIIEKMRLDGKKGFVTGAARGIGKCTATAFAEAGADVAIVDLDFEEAQKTAKELAEKTGRKFADYFDKSIDEYDHPHPGIRMYYSYIHYSYWIGRFRDFGEDTMTILGNGSDAVISYEKNVLGKEKIKECYYSVAFTEKGAQHVMNLHNGWQEKIEHFNEYAYMEIEKMDTIDSMPVSLDKNGNFVNKN